MPLAKFIEPRASRRLRPRAGLPATALLLAGLAGSAAVAGLGHPFVEPASAQAGTRRVPESGRGRDRHRPGQRRDGAALRHAPRRLSGAGPGAPPRPGRNEERSAQAGYKLDNVGETIMGLLDSVIGSVVGQVLGGGRGQAGMSPIVKALLMLLLTKGVSGGGLGSILGGGGAHADTNERSGGAGPYGRDPGHGADDGVGDIGGFGQGGRGSRHPEVLPEGDFSDLSGMLDGPGGASRRTGASGGEDADLGGLDGLIDRFRQGGMGDAVESWIGHGPNHAVAPDQVGAALGPGALDSLQSQTGLGRDELLGQLAKVLPEVVSQLTPHGKLPDASERQGW